ncbi:MAG: tetratricopeptide repeat protein [Verrucomicrobiae bacterium]|nr:tetratricopeptide repeat protein [Verrucomicrobiae bacterium]
MNGTFDSHLKRGQLLHNQGRYAEAESFYKQALAEDPHNPDALMLLGWCQFLQDKRETNALHSVEMAIGLDPENGHSHCLRAIILSRLKRHKDAHEAADRAIALTPDAADSYAAKAQVFAGEQKWADMEHSAREALGRDGDHDHAQNLLTQSLLLQGKTDENAFNVERQLARDPDDPMPHFNAGYAALRRGDYRKAEEHFRESLRLSPSFESAREGMLESFRARSIVYRSYLKWNFWLAKFSSKYRFGIIIGLYVLYRVVVGALQKVSPLLAFLVIALYLLFALWTHVARGVGNLIVLMDRNARMALRKPDVIEGVLVGGAICTGLLTVIAGAALGILPLLLGGATLCTAAVPLAASFKNEDSIGVKLYTGLAIAIFAMGATDTVMTALGVDAGSLTSAWMLTFVASIWLSAFGVKRG